MDYWTNPSVWREHRRELLREARQLAQEARKSRKASAHSKKRPASVEVRWGLQQDDAKVAELLQLNGMPRWIAFEERFVVAERGDSLLAAVRYRTEPKRMLLGLLVTDPWSGRSERRLAVTLYAGTRELARDMGAREILAKTARARADYLHEAGYHRWGGYWRLDTTRPVRPREELPAVGWRRWIRLPGAFIGALFPPRNAPASPRQASGYQARENVEGSNGENRLRPIAWETFGRPEVRLERWRDAWSN